MPIGWKHSHYWAGALGFYGIGSEEDLFGGSTADPIVASITVPALGANRIGIVFVNIVNSAAATTVTGITWNGVSMNYAIAVANSTDKRVEIWYLVGCAHNGTYDISVDVSNTNLKEVSIVTVWANADDTIALDDTSSETGTGYDCDIVSTQISANELVVSTSVSQCNNLDSPVSPDATEVQSYDQGGNTTITTYTIPASSGNATHTHGYSDFSELNYAMVSASFKSGIVLTAEQIDSNIHLSWILP